MANEPGRSPAHGENESDHSSVDANAGQRAERIWTLALIAGIWIGSDIGYYFLLPTLGQKSNYNDGPKALYDRVIAETRERWSGRPLEDCR